MPIEELKKYLCDALELEKIKYQTERIINTVDVIYQPDFYRTLSYSALNVDPVLVHKQEKRFKTGLRFLIFGFAFVVIILALSVITQSSSFIGLAFISVPFIYGGAGLMLFNYRYRTGKKDLESIDEENVKVASHNEEAERIAKEKNRITKNAITKLKATLNLIEEKRHLLYSSDLIHPKYRNLVAISSILEYFDTGRCTKLEEAYDRFESESRMDRIITQLDEVISRLDQIANNQYYLYNALNSIQSCIDRQCAAIEQSTERLNEISANTALTAYQSEIQTTLQIYNTYH